MNTVIPIHLCCLVIVYLLQLTAGYQIAKKSLVGLGWGCLLITLGFIAFVFSTDPPLLKMLAIIVTTFTAMKIVVVAESYRDKQFKLSFLQWLVFVAGWAGMRPQAFENLFGKSMPGSWQLIKDGLIRVFIGVALLTLVPTLMNLPIDPRVMCVVNSGIMLVGLSLILHFGILSISAGIWRFFGADTYLLFRQPTKSNSLTEFWGRRWNLAFIEMLSIAILRPLKAKIGNTTAVIISFLLSGLLHEVAITLPVNAGFGMPTVYFIIQGFAVVAEKKMEKQNVIFLKNRVVAKFWVLLWLIAPLGFLFPIPFIEKIIWPLTNWGNIW